MDEAHGIGRCRVYETRFGLHKTVGGKQFQCSTIANRLLLQGADPGCGYADVISINGQKVPEPVSFTV